MKKTLAVIVLAVFVASIIPVALAAGKGAVKTPLYKLDGGTVTDEVVGFVVINTTGSGKVIVNVVLCDADPDATYNAAVRVPKIELGEFTTDENGDGSLNAHLDLTSFTSEDGVISLQVGVRQLSPSRLHYATTDEVDVPVKKVD